MSDDGGSVTLTVPDRPALSRSNTVTSDLSGQGSKIQLQTLKNTLLKSHGRPPW
jgi:uridine kinase